VVNTSGSLFGNTLDLGEELRVLFVNEPGEITTVIEDHVERLAIGESLKRLLDAPVVLFLSLTLPGKDGHTSSGNGSSGMVLSRVDVA